MPSVLVTGGAGFIGSHLVEALLEKGYAVTVLDNLFSGSKKNLSAVMDRITFVKGDIRDKKTAEKAMAGCDHVLHLAARRSVPGSLKEPMEYNDVNIMGTLVLLEAARKNKVKSFVFASSSSVYGNVREFPQKESFPANPLSPYALTKLAGEHYLRLYHDLHGLNTVSLRYFNVFGPRQDPNSQYSAVIPLFIKAVMNGKSPEIQGDGEQSRDFTYVANVVEGNICAMNSSGCGGEVFNIANGENISVNALLAKINSLLGRKVRPIHADSREGDVRKTQADSSKAKKRLGYTGRIGFDEGLKKTVAWFSSNPEMLN